MPSMTGASLSVAEFLRKGKKVMPDLVRTKFTYNNLIEMGECLALNNGEFEVLHGYDEILISGLGSIYNYLLPIYLGIMDVINKGNIKIKLWHSYAGLD